MSVRCEDMVSVGERLGLPPKGAYRARRQFCLGIDAIFLIQNISYTVESVFYSDGLPEGGLPQGRRPRNDPDCLRRVMLLSEDEDSDLFVLTVDAGHWKLKEHPSMLLGLQGKPQWTQFWVFLQCF